VCRGRISLSILISLRVPPCLRGGKEKGDYGHAYTARVGRAAAVPGGHPDQAARPPRQAQGGGTALTPPVVTMQPVTAPRFRIDAMRVLS
jgi:hypothetical protein